MNAITKTPLSRLGYHFIEPEYIPVGKDEYYLRFQQNPDHSRYRPLTPAEIAQLEANGNISDDWSNVLVSAVFHTAQIKQCKFYGLVRIGNTEPVYLQFHDIRLPVGLYNSTIISCDIGDNNVVSHVNYMSHYITGSEVVLVNINELEVSNHAKFGNGIIRQGEKEAVRIWLEICNENGRRSILPFDSMQTGDAWLWSRYRDDDTLMQRFKDFTEKQFDDRRGYYGTIGDRTVVKNCRIIKDVKIGTDAYIKGTNKLKNLTIHSSETAPTQIGEGCELVNGIMGYGSKAFYGVKAVRFFLASHSQLKYGARLINSFLGDNSTISCCEVLNSLIFPAHEQHHNNSFLCAAVLKGQTNMAAGATIGSNHNSRGADGELIAGRGFWPGLCVSLKHNSMFASFTILAKGDYPAELNIPLPFSLVSNDVTNNQLTIMPAYWFMYNMYALARNAGKYESRDKRTLKNQYLEYDYLAPDTINELLDALHLLKKSVGKSLSKEKISDKEAVKKGEKILESGKDISKKEILLENAENSQRKVVLIKVAEAYRIFKELLIFHGIEQLLYLATQQKTTSFKQLLKTVGKEKRTEWVNVGGQLIPAPAIEQLLQHIRSGNIKDWESIHQFYHQSSDEYPLLKAKHAITAMLEVLDLPLADFSLEKLKSLCGQAIATREWMAKGIHQSRQKDYENPFRKMVYATEAEMNKIVGAFNENVFIRQQEEEVKRFHTAVGSMLKSLKA